MPDIKIAVIQFPGSNTERETGLAIQRAGMDPVEFLWNMPHKKLTDCQGYIIVGGFSYEDRSRAGVIASLDPIMRVLDRESKKGKPVLGICNGAQILVESGLVPGLADGRVGVALTDNKRVQNGKIIGTGYYNAWTNLQLSVEPNRTAFTRHLNIGDFIHVPFAHAEGRFIIPETLLEKLINRGQSVFRYCDEDGNIISEFPSNPNGSIYNLAAVCNPGGNVMAIMPHPERTEKGDAIFTSMREYIYDGIPSINQFLKHDRSHFTVNPYAKQKNTLEWIIDLVITDNEAVSVQNALIRLGLAVSISRQTHWEIHTDRPDLDKFEIQIENTGELYNSNKEIRGKLSNINKSATFLVRHKEDMMGRQKRESLMNRFGVDGIIDLKKGVLWNITVNSGNFEAMLDAVLDTHILFNPLSYDCFRVR